MFLFDVLMMYYIIWWFGHSVFGTFVQLTEGRSAQDIPSSRQQKKKCFKTKQIAKPTNTEKNESIQTTMKKSKKYAKCLSPLIRSPPWTSLELGETGWNVEWKRAVKQVP